jgi:tetratricopeptide (TPR) repeat protein
MVIKRNKTNIYALYMLGVIYNEKQNFDSAILVLQNAINYKTQGSVVVDYRNEGLMKEKARYDVEYNELIYTQGLSHYYKRNLKQASNIFSFCISNNYRLGESYLFKGIITIETQKNYKEACKDIQLAEQYGNRNASMYKEKFCR